VYLLHNTYVMTILARYMLMGNELCKCETLCAPEMCCFEHTINVTVWNVIV